MGRYTESVEAWIAGQRTPPLVLVLYFLVSAIFMGVGMWLHLAAPGIGGSPILIWFLPAGAGGMAITGQKLRLNRALSSLKVELTVRNSGD